MMTEAQERKMFGTTLEAFKQSLPPYVDLADPAEAMRLSASIQSDVQEVLQFGDLERARQMLNLSKWVLFGVADRLTDLARGVQKSETRA